jgi:hypothetical protein
MILVERGFRQPALPPAGGIFGKWFICSSWNIMLMILYVRMFHVKHLWWQYCMYISVRGLAASDGSEVG